MDLKCRQLNCKYNDKFCCTRKGILISKQNICSDYEKYEELPADQKQDVSKTMFEKEPKIHPYRHNKKVKIDCKSPCLFNEGGTCKANGICVEECPSTTAVCITHMPE